MGARPGAGGGGVVVRFSDRDLRSGVVAQTKGQGLMKERLLIGGSVAFGLGVVVGVLAKLYSAYSIYILCGPITWPFC